MSWLCARWSRVVNKIEIVVTWVDNDCVAYHGGPTLTDDCVAYHGGPTLTDEPAPTE
jgi:hypothetical protein